MDNVIKIFDDKKRISILILTFLIGFNISVLGGRSVVAQADVGSLALDGVVLAEGVGALGVGVSAPVVLGVAGALVLGGVVWQNREEIAGVCGYIAKNVAGAVTEVGGKVLVDGKKVIDKYNELRESKYLSKNYQVTGLDNAPRGVMLQHPTNDYRLGIIVPKGGSARIDVPEGSYAFSGYGGIERLYSDDNLTLKYPNLANRGYGDYTFGEPTYLKNGDVFVSFTYYRKTEDGAFPYPNFVHLKKDYSIPFPSGLGSAGDIGNDTFVSVPSDTSISADSVIGKTAKELSNSKSISVSRGVDGVAVPLDKVYGDVLVGDNAIPLTGEGAIPLTGEGAIPLTREGVVTKELTSSKTGQATATGEGVATGELSGVKDLTFNDTISNTIDFSPIKAVGQGLTEVFPFSIPFDFVRGVKLLVAPSEAPKFDIKMDKHFVGSGEFTIDFTQFEKWATIIRFFIALSFSVFVVLKTRDLIKG